MAKKTTIKKRYTIYYAQKGATSDLSYVANIIANSVKDAKDKARWTVWLMMKDKKGTRGTVQLNQFMKSLKFYTK